MDLLEAILEEHSKAQTDKIIRYIGHDPKRFAVLVNLFVKGEYRVSQRAGWPMSYIARKYPALVKPYFKQLLDLLQKPSVHPAVVRNIVRLLQDVEIPKRYHGRVMSCCFDYIADIEAPIATKAFSLTILHQLSAEYPEIKTELKLIIEERMEHETAAFKSRGKKILAAFKKEGLKPR